MKRTSHFVHLLILSAVTSLLGCSGTDSPTGTGPADGRDVTPPSPVTDLVLSVSKEENAVHLEWTAPHDDSATEPVAGYEIRFAYTTGYEPEDFWNAAMTISDAPTPAEPGSRERYTIEDPRRGRDLYAGIRGVDEEGNRSSPAGWVTTHVPGFSFSGICVDVFTRQPIEGLSVRVSTGPVYEYTTDPSGGFVHDEELDEGVTYVDISTGSSSTLYHSVHQSLVLEDDSTHSFFMIPVEQVNATWVPNLLALFKSLVYFPLSAGGSTGYSTLRSQILAKWHTTPVRCYAPPYVNDPGIDYEQQAKLAAARWMERTGEPLFEFVDSPPDTGIILTYKPRSDMAGIGVTRHTPGEDGHPLRDDVWVVNDLGDSFTLYKIFLHEFGHTIPLGHVEDPAFIMYIAQPIPDDISDDEVRVVQLHRSLPTRIDMSIYEETFPPARAVVEPIAAEEAEAPVMGSSSVPGGR